MLFRFLLCLILSGCAGYGASMSNDAQRQADVWAKQGDLLYRQHRSGEAVDFWQKAIHADPKLVEPRWSLATVYSERGDKEKARDLYLEVLAMDPTHYAARQNLAVHYSEQGLFDEAEREYRELLNYTPNDSNAHHGLGLVLIKKEQWQEAKTQLEKALALDRKESAWGTASLHIAFATTLRKTGHLDEAEKQLKQALNLLSTERFSLGSKISSWVPPSAMLASANIEAACIFTAQSRMAEAIASLASAISADPQARFAVEHNPDLVALRETAEYRALMTEVNQSHLSLIEAHFIATIKAIEVLGQSEASLAFAEPNARWLVTLELTQVEKASPLFDQPGIVRIAVHSPTRLFARAPKTALEKQYAFKIGGEIQAKKAQYTWIQAFER
jgi:Tfp pilus assembly protein PilF